jgi:hypothetical protein
MHPNDDGRIQNVHWQVKIEKQPLAIDLRVLNIVHSPILVIGF